MPAALTAPHRPRSVGPSLQGAGDEILVDRLRRVDARAPAAPAPATIAVPASGRGFLPSCAASITSRQMLGGEAAADDVVHRAARRRCRPRRPSSGGPCSRRTRRRGSPARFPSCRPRDGRGSAARRPVPETSAALSISFMAPTCAGATSLPWAARLAHIEDASCAREDAAQHVRLGRAAAVGEHVVGAGQLQQRDLRGAERQRGVLAERRLDAEPARRRRNARGPHLSASRTATVFTERASAVRSVIAP